MITRLIAGLKEQTTNQQRLYALFLKPQSYLTLNVHPENQLLRVAA